MATTTTTTSSSSVIRAISAREGTLREYETVMILRPSAGRTDIIDLVRRMQERFEEMGARLLRVDNWGMRTLAYTIRGQSRGIYLYWRFLGGSDTVAEFERLLRNLDLIVRYATIRIDDDVDPEARPSELTEELLSAVGDTAPEPAPPQPTRSSREGYGRDRDDFEGDGDGGLGDGDDVDDGEER